MQVGLVGVGGEGGQRGENVCNGARIWMGLVCNVAWITDDNLISFVCASDNDLIHFVNKHEAYKMISS